MSESKIVYVNDDYDSDQDNAIIYGSGASSSVTEAEVKPSNINDIENVVEKPESNVEVVQNKNEQVVNGDGVDVIENKDEQVGYSDEVVGDEMVQNKDEQVVDNDSDSVDVIENKDDVNDENEGSIFGGGEGYNSEPDANSSVSSLDTDAILNVDPLYFRLTKFLQTGGDEPENVAEILKKINTNLEFMNQNLMKLMTAKVSQ